MIIFFSLIISFAIAAGITILIDTIRPFRKTKLVSVTFLILAFVIEFAAIIRFYFIK